MDQDEIDEALEKGRLPMTFGDKMLMVMMAGLGVAMIYLEGETYIKWGLGTMLGSFFLCFPLLAFMCWRWFWSIKKLIPYNSDLPFDKKTTIIEQLIKDNKQPIYKDFSRKPVKGYYAFTYSKSWYKNYGIQIFYNTTCYYIGSTIGFGNSESFSTDTAIEIIDKIKKLEVVLS